MTTLDVWTAWYDAFERSARDDQWERLADLLTPDIQYRVVGAPLACTVKGRDNVIAGFRRSFNGFDRRFDRRTHVVAGTKITEPGHVEARIWGVYEKAGLPALAFPATGFLHVDEDRVGMLIDVYDLTLNESQAAMSWLAQHSNALSGLDPRYIE